VLALIERLVPLLLAGDDPRLGVLRLQFSLATVESVEMTGVGFFANFSTPPETPRVMPAEFVGGSAEIDLEGTTGAGCKLFVVKAGSRFWRLHLRRRGVERECQNRCDTER